MKTYNRITAKLFPTDPAIFEAMERWLEDERRAIAADLTSPDPKAALEGWPYAWASSENVALHIRSGGDQQGQTPREFDPAIALVFRLCVGAVGASLRLEAVRRQDEGGGQLYPSLNLGRGEGRNFKAGRITNNTPEGKSTRSHGTHYNCRAQNLYSARPEDHHRDPYQAGKGRFITIALARYDDLMAMKQSPIALSRDRFERLLHGLLEVHTMREQGRPSLQAA